MLTLPSGRRLHYPEARLVPGKFEDTRQLRFKDNARGAWNDVDAWYGVLVENAVQATARDLLAAAMRRIEAADYPVVLSVHDEIVAEVPEGFGSVEEFHRLMVQLPDWAEGLPIAAKAWTRPRYAKAITTPAQPATSPSQPRSPAPIDLPTPELDDDGDEEPDLSDALDTVPLADLITEPLTGGRNTCANTTFSTCSAS